MATQIDTTHDPATESWVESANEQATDFPIQNLPFGRFRDAHDADWRIGVAIGDEILDLRRCGLIGHNEIRQLLQLQPVARRELRRTIHAGLSSGSTSKAAWRRALVPASCVQLGLPCEIRDYTDFYVGIHHATAVGKLFRPECPLLPNYKWVPIGYHGRASTLLPSGVDFVRPVAQVKGTQDSVPSLSATQRLDFELELGVVIGRPNDLGAPVDIDTAEEHVFGLTLFNDWSARDFQAWEYQPLGPFLSKNFAGTLSPWIVTLEALAPFRRPLVRPDGDPSPLPYLDNITNRKSGAIDVDLVVLLQTQAMLKSGRSAEVISRSNFADAAYWTVAQLVAHHTVNGCALSSGDLFGTGTLSGVDLSQSGSLLELTEGGTKPIVLGNGETRTFLQDGDAVMLRGECRREGFRRIGFGDCFAAVLPASVPLGREQRLRH